MTSDNVRQENDLKVTIPSMSVMELNIMLVEQQVTSDSKNHQQKE